MNDKNESSENESSSTDGLPVPPKGMGQEKNESDTGDRTPLENKTMDISDDVASGNNKNKDIIARLKHLSIEWKIGIIAAVIIVAIGSLFGTHALCIHSWAEATCVLPKTCRICGATEGDALGHNWNRATCTEPETCTRCGETKGSPLGHEWQDATCELSKRCKRCGETVGSPLGHDVSDWKVTKEATCTEEGSEEGTCKRCHKKQTKSIPKTDHVLGDWEVSKDYSVDSSGDVTPGVQVQKCKVCGQVINQKEYSVKLTTSQINALQTAQSYLDFMGFSYSGLVDQLEYEGYSTEDSTFAADHCGADWMVQAERVAKSYMDNMSFSRSGLIGQLEYEGFSADQAAHGADSVGL